MMHMSFCMLQSGSTQRMFCRMPNIKDPYAPSEAQLQQYLVELGLTDNGAPPGATVDDKFKDAKLIRNRMKLTNVYYVRQRSGKTQEQCATAIGISRRMLSDIENGQREPSVFTAIALAELFNTEVGNLFHLQEVQIVRHDKARDYWTLVKRSRRRKPLPE